MRTRGCAFLMLLVLSSAVVAADHPLDPLSRPEEWPIMTAHRVGFTRLPAGFFSENPTLDVP